ncbi:MAG: NAD-glutamate dehydrogenase [Nocardioidaceae bacterium]
MATVQTEALDELIDEAAATGGLDPCRADLGPDRRHALLEHYYAHVVREDLADRTPEDICGAALSHYCLAGTRPQGTATARVFTPTTAADGWSAAGRTVIEIVTDDMPFLVDSVGAYLGTSGHLVELVIHPQMLVERDVAGALRDFTSRTLDDDVPPSGPQIRESWMHLEVPRIATAEQRQVETGLLERLRDVRESVEDWSKMVDRARAVVDELHEDPPPVPAAELAEAEELLSWLCDDHFTFLGYREYALGTEDDGVDVLRAVPGTGLGVLRSDQEISHSLGRLPAPVAAKAREKQLLIVTKANSRSTVHRPVHLDYVGVKKFDRAGDVCGERRFLGLLTSAAYTQSVAQIPVLRRKAHDVLAQLGYAPMSHSGKALMDFLETYPRDELFQTSFDQLTAIATSVLHMAGRRQLRLFVRRDDYGRFLSCIVYLPRDRYTTTVRLRMQAILASAIGGDPTVDYTAWVTESLLARLHFVVRAPRGEVVPDVDVTALEQRLADATRSWSDDLGGAAVEEAGQVEAERLLGAWGEAFPEAYKEDFPARTAVADLLRLESIDPADGIALQPYEPAALRAGEGRFKVFRTGQPLSLWQVLPLFAALGIEVVDERPYALTRADLPAWVYDFGLRYTSGPIRDDTRELFTDAFLACWRGQVEPDGFNRLVMSADLTWRQVSVLRSYAKYLRQAGTPFSQSYLEASLLANQDIARLLVELFEARFEPGGHGDLAADVESRVAKVEGVEQAIARALDEVDSLDQDRILRSYRSLVRATVRTNYFQTDPAGRPKPYVSFKLEPQHIDVLPEPRPRYEIFVHSPRVEGVHLRFGDVARGGLRWSDRAEDFRTEVLGLAKAQMVKNAVIVPVGAKGGFYCKRLPDPAVDRDAWLAEGIACYRTFICGLLDLTDNLVDGLPVPPEQLVRHDGDDTYLVVAADKGTATFSDIANAVAADYGFWLGDAFASGGSAGYDHKAMGITARGAWVAVQRHFRDLGLDCQTQDFTCVGIGDMSGDVFGNGMLLSEHTRLLAAFDHRHVFLDPDPDPASSFAERRRLFDLPRSSWADYDTGLISAGGGVFPRSAKSIPVSPQVQGALGLDSSATSLTPAQLLTAILKAPVDLLWNGGIGTYVKASTESQAEAGDRANDAIRVNGDELRCRCVGEGGNLGLTQRGRVEYARGGGRINTDFIDNSAGVDTSDHEVNIKILLDKVVLAGGLSGQQRNELLASMTEEVATLVLADNYDQNVALANAVAQAPQLLHVHGDWMRRLEKAGLLHRDIEFLPNTKEITQRLGEGRGLSSPELAVLLAYTKIVLARDLVDSGLADDDFLRGALYSYFPSQMRQDYRRQMDEHPLRREIIVTQIVNELVNGAGITFFHRLSGETGARAAELARAHAAAQEIYGTVGLVREINALDNRIEAGVQTRMRLAVRTVAERATRWLVNNRRSGNATSAVDYFDPMVGRVVQALPAVLCGRERAELEQAAADLQEAGVPEELAVRVAAMAAAYSAIGIVDVAQRDSLDPVEVATVHFVLGERLNLDRISQRILALPRDDRWRTMARASLRDDLQSVHAQLTSRVLAQTSSDQSAGERVEAWAADEGTELERSMATLDEVWADDSPDLARLSVGLRVVRSLVSG